MILVVGLGLALQVAQSPPPTKADSIEREITRKVIAELRSDSVARAARMRARRQSSPESKRRDVTATDLATAFKDSDSREMLNRARVARLAQDSALRSYDAMTYQRISAGIAFSRIGRDRLVFRTERADRVRWERDVGLWIDVKGARTVLPGIPEIGEREAGKGIAGATEMAAVPYVPGLEQLWVGPMMAERTVDENGPVHPMAEGSEAYYTYRTGEPVKIRLADGREIHLRELEVRPREPKWNLVVGSMWFDAESGQLVRAAYRFAVPMEIDAFVNEQDPTAFDDVPVWVKPMIFPMRGTITAVTIDYALFAGRFWLPKSRSAEGSGQASFMRVPLKFEQSFTYAAVNGDEKMPPLPPLPALRLQPPDSLVGDARLAWRDSVRAVRQAATLARRDSIRAGLLQRTRPIAPCDTGTYRLSTSRQYADAPVPVATRIPCDLDALANSPDLPKSIYDPGDELFDLKARDALIAEALAMGVQPPFVLDPRLLPKPTLLYGLQLVRYNRVEGLSLGLAVNQIFGGGYTADVLGRFGLADREPNVEVGVTRSNLARAITLSAYNHLVSAGDWGNPLSFGSSFSAAMFGKDEGFYYRASGIQLGGRTEQGAPVEWRFSIERQRAAAAETNFGLMAKNAIPNIGATTGTYPVLAVRARPTLGLDPRGLRLFSDLRLEAAGGDSTFGRAALDLTATKDIGWLSTALTASGGSSVGSLPVQRKWYLGGSHTVRGQAADTAASGSAYWLARAEFGTTIQGTRPVIFGDLGWVGDRNRMREVGRPLSGVGVGASLLDGLMRFDVSRGLHPLKQWRVDFYLDAVF